ncbi:MAG: GrpB family protein [Rikenellaceae bacterium]|nr:GrpB family protein [Rikenellaceae bacterium]
MAKELNEMSNEELWKLFPIILTDYDPEWPSVYAKQKAILKNLIGKNICRIRHIGSTSVPGLKAKPTIDILMEINETTDITEMSEKLKNNGWILNDRPQQHAPHLLFLKGYTLDGFENEVFHLHVRYVGDWDEIHFRNSLVNHSETAKEYAELKSVLANKFRNDRDGYTEAKTDFMKKITATARGK